MKNGRRQCEGETCADTPLPGMPLPLIKEDETGFRGFEFSSLRHLFYRGFSYISVLSVP